MHASTRALQAALLARLAPLGLTAGAQAAVERAMRASFTVHNGTHRPGGIPYPDHPLTVALRLLDSGAAQSASHLVAALLHDAVEDAHEALVGCLEGPGAARGATPGDALRAIAEQLDPLAADWVRHLTNPDFDAAVAHLPGPERPAARRALYREHVVGLVDACPDAFLVKFEDFSENALSLHAVDDGPRRQKLKEKYGPVVSALRERLEALADPAHPVTPHRARMLVALERAWVEQYAAP